MVVFQAKPREWGNSIGVTIPSEIVEQEHIRTDKPITLLLVPDHMDLVRKTFGTLKFKKPTQQIMDELDEEGYD
ncbi:MAG TPA: hypothetical protein VJH22_06380 [Candidatus Nanoarchaeia archaeon]|nr:hypothetical protein [Candidatus Nanoarchaeia archaeon]